MSLTRRCLCLPKAMLADAEASVARAVRWLRSAYVALALCLVGATFVTWRGVHDLARGLPLSWNDGAFLVLGAALLYGVVDIAGRLAALRQRVRVSLFMIASIRAFLARKPVAEDAVGDVCVANGRSPRP